MTLISLRTAPLVVGAVLLAVLSSLVWHLYNQSSPLEAPNLQVLEAHLERMVAKGNPPALAVAVVKGQETVYLRAFGFVDPLSRVKATPETLLNWWSITKIFTAVAILQLVERQRLALDQEVATVLPFFQSAYPDENCQSITIVHLLNHSAGLPEAGLRTYRWLRLDGVLPSQRTFAAETIPIPVRIEYEPGTKGIYTNYGYLLLGAVIETVSGLEYRDYVEQQILEPLKMNSTVFQIQGDLEHRTASGSHPLFDLQTLLLPALRNVPAFIRSYSDGKIWFERFQFSATACGGLIGSVRDLSRFMKTYLNGGQLDGARILDEDSVDLMTHSHRVPAGRGRQSRLYPGLSHGIGWFVVPCGDRNCLQHTGFGPGFTSIMRFYPEERMGIVMLSNGSAPDRGRLVDLIATLFRRSHPEHPAARLEAR